MNTKPIKIRRALISVSNKKKLLDLVNILHKYKIEMIASEETTKYIKSIGIPCTIVSNFTNCDMIFNGLVKTIHPNIVGGIMGDREIHHEEAQKRAIKWIDLVICNFYPFDRNNTEKIKNEGNIPALNQIDIGGPTIVRSSAKNMGWVCVLTDIDNYKDMSQYLEEEEGIPFSFRKRMAKKAFDYVAQYDIAIARALGEKTLDEYYYMAYKKHETLRYGENKHQKAALYIPCEKRVPSIDLQIHHGKVMSYNNHLDVHSAWQCVSEFDEPTAVIVKHNVPCGVASRKNITEAFIASWEADSISSYGGIVALNKVCKLDVAREIIKSFFEVIIAPSFDDDAIEELKKKKNLRMVSPTINKTSSIEYKSISDDLLVQETDYYGDDIKTWQLVTKQKPSDEQWKDMLFGWRVVRYVKSNAIVVCRDTQTKGISGGQVNRIDAVKYALERAGKNAHDSVLCSDGFFPFRDSIDYMVKLGVNVVVQPGGSMRDEEVIQAANEHDMIMVFTDRRCFRH